MYNFNRLEVYRRADAFSDVVHGATLHFPKHEKYALGNQMNRAVDSIVLNISEGGGADSDAEVLQFLRYAVKSSNEVEAGIRRTWKLGYLRGGEKEGDKMKNEIVEIRGRTRHTLYIGNFKGSSVFIGQNVAWVYEEV